MKTLINATTNVTKKTLINAKTGIPLKDANGDTLSVIAAALYEEPDKETGEVKEAGLLVTDKGVCYTTISETAMDFISDLIGIIDDESGKVQQVMVDMRQSNSGREFIAMTLL